MHMLIPFVYMIYIVGLLGIMTQEYWPTILTITAVGSVMLPVSFIIMVAWNLKPQTAVNHTMKMQRQLQVFTNSAPMDDRIPAL